MNKYLLSLVLVFGISFANAQHKKSIGKTATSYKLLKTIKNHGFNHQLYIKKIKEEVLAVRISTEDPNEPQVVTATKILMNYDNDHVGAEYVLYFINKKGKKELELTFPKQILNGENKIIAEGTYLLNGKSLSITVNVFDYHFPTKTTYLYSLNRLGKISFVEIKQNFLETDGFSEEYIKKAEEKTIKDN